MKTVRLSGLLLLLTAVPSVALAQAASGHARPFEALAAVLRVGQGVKITDQAGRGVKGKVASITSDELVVVAPKAFFRREERSFPKDNVKTIDAVDSTWNGALIGGGAAATVLSVWAGRCESGECMQGRALYAVLGTSIGFVVGAALDSEINRRIYDRQSDASRITLVPWLERGLTGVLARVGF